MNRTMAGVPVSRTRCAHRPGETLAPKSGRSVAKGTCRSRLRTSAICDAGRSGERYALQRSVGSTFCTPSSIQTCLTEPAALIAGAQCTVENYDE